MVVILYSSIIRDLLFNKQYYTNNNIPYIHWSFNNSKHDKQRDVTFIERAWFRLCFVVGGSLCGFVCVLVGFVVVAVFFQDQLS